MNNVNSYELPPIRCFNCNKPIAHLYEQYKNLINIMNIDNSNLNKEIFDILNIKNPCCREKLYLPEIIIIDKPDENMISGIISSNTNKPEQKPKLTQLKQIIAEPKIIKNNEQRFIPISYNVSHKKKKINESMYISYATNMTFLTQ
jgi:DNA-directed RNA polymerase subunit N (RpoN/RPB10)